MIGIRADANSIIATGHMMRCITIAKALVMQGEIVTFFMADRESESLFKSFGGDSFFGVVLDTDYRDMEGELGTLGKELRKRNIQILLVDSYSATKTYFEKLSEICKVAYLDDLAKEGYPVNLVINYSGYSKNMGYERIYNGVRGFGGSDTKLLLGLQYAPLREQFYSSDDNINVSYNAGFAESSDGHSLDVLLATGGSDMCNMITSVLDKASKAMENIRWYVVVGDFVEKPEAIEAYAKEHNNIFIYRSVKDMAELMRKCDVAILAAGTMLTECAAVRLPTIFYQVADNQKFNVEYFGALRGMIFAGDVHSGHENKEKTLNKIFDELKKLSLDRLEIKAMSESLSEITDGRGAVRIAKALMDEIR